MTRITLSHCSIPMQNIISNTLSWKAEFYYGIKNPDFLVCHIQILMIKILAIFAYTVLVTFSLETIQNAHLVLFFGKNYISYITKRWWVRFLGPDFRDQYNKNTCIPQRTWSQKTWANKISAYIWRIFFLVNNWLVYCPFDNRLIYKKVRRSC